jgi:hypothetical protein
MGVLMKMKKANRAISFLLTFLILMSFKTSMVFADDLMTKYSIKATFDTSLKTFTVNETVNFKNTYGENLNSLVFHLYADSYGDVDSMSGINQLGNSDVPLTEKQIGDINITKVTIDNKSMQFTQDSQILKIALKDSLKSNEKAIVNIEFTLKLPEGSGRLGYLNNIYSVTNWYPIMSIYDANTHKWDENKFHPNGESNYSDVSNYNISLTLPDDMKVASTGILNYTNKSYDGSNIKTFNMSAEKARDFVFIMSPDFKVITKKVNKITVNSFYIDTIPQYSEEVSAKVGSEEVSAKATAENLLDVACDALDFFSKNFGEYPYEEFDMVETYFQGGAMEYPQLIQMPKYYPSFAGESSWLEEATVHEVGHQWWYSIVGNNEFSESFLDESLTAYSTAYYYEKKHGKYSDKGIVMTIRSRIFPEGKTIPINSSVAEFKDMQQYFKAIYHSGSIVFEDLHQKVGDEKFLEILQSYFNKYKMKNASIEGLLNIIEEKGGKDAADLVRTAINSDSYFPEHLVLTKEEQQQVQREQFIMQLKHTQVEGVKNIGSFLLNSINDATVYIVKPSNVSNLSSVEKDLLTSSIATTKSSLESTYSIKVIVKDDKDITSEEFKTGNLILIGNPTINSMTKSIVTSLPVKFLDPGISFDDVTIKSKDVQGLFLVENPQNTDKCMLVIIGFKQPIFLEAYDYQTISSQFNFRLGNKQFTGSFDVK